MSIHPEPIIKFNTKNKKSEFITLEIKLNEVTELMGWKAVGSKISDFKISNLEDISPAAEAEIQFEIEEPSNDNNDDDPSIQITLF